MTEFEKELVRFVSGYLDAGVSAEDYVKAFSQRLLDSIGRQSKPKVSDEFEKEFIRYIHEKDAEVSERGESTYTQEDLEDIARHFYELGSGHSEKPNNHVSQATEKPELMKRPTDEDLCNSEYNAPRFEDLTQKVKFGREMKSDDMTVWHFPKGIKEKIEDDSLYRVYYRWHDSADSSDSTTFYDVYYIQEI